MTYFPNREYRVKTDDGSAYEVAVTMSHVYNVTGAGDEYFNVVDYGADNTGATDTVSSEQQAFDACEAAGGGTVFYSSGTYLRAANHVTIPSGVEIRIKGDMAWIDGAGTADHAFVFDTGGGVEYPTFPLVIFEDIYMKNFEWRAIEASTYDTGGRSTITRLEMTGCQFDNTDFGAFFYTKIGSALISGNTFENFSGDAVGCLQVGSKYEADVANIGYIIIKDNIVKNIVSTHASDTHHALIAFGNHVVFENNIITDNTSTGTVVGAGPSAIGVKAYDVLIHGNILTNAGGSTDGHIYVKGLERDGTGDSPFDNGGPSYNIIISDNIVISTEEELWNASENGISVDGGDNGKDNVHIHGNYIEGLRSGGVKVEGDGDHNDITIENNTINNTRTNYGIRVNTTGKRISVCGNRVTGFGTDGTEANPIGIRVDGAGALTDLVVSRNTISDDGLTAGSGAIFGLYLRQAAGDMTNATVKDNIVSLTGTRDQRGLEIIIADTGSVTHGNVKDNEIEITDTLGYEYGISSSAEIYYDKDDLAPEGRVYAPIGKTFVDLGGGAGVTLYVKESGDWTNTGWKGVTTA